MGLSLARFLLDMYDEQNLKILKNKIYEQVSGLYKNQHTLL